MSSEPGGRLCVMTNRFGDDAAAAARALIAGNRYLTLGTADASGAPWTSPVWFAATGDLSHVLWVSEPQARHSRNLAARPEVSVVIFDSTALPGGAQAFYASAVAEQVAAADVDGAIAAYSRRSVQQGLAAWSVADVTAPARHRLYRAALRECFVLGAQDRRVPVPSLGTG